MGFIEHSLFQPPPTADARIWRYMDLVKLLSILDKLVLYFVRLDKLSSMDAFEGHYTSLHIKLENLKFEDIPKEYREKYGIEDEIEFKSFQRGPEVFESH